MAFNPFELIIALRALQHLPKLDDVLQAVNHPGGGGFAITSGTASFLVIGFQAFGQVQVGDKSNVGLVDAHTEGNGGHDNHAVFAQKALLVPGACLAVQPSVVGQRCVPFLLQ